MPDVKVPLADDVAREVEAIKAIREKVNGFRAAASQRPWSEDEADQMYGFCLRLLRRLEGMLDKEVPTARSGPVASEDAALVFKVAMAKLNERAVLYTSDTRTALDSAMPLLARDHGLLTRAEVERRAREWWSSHYGRPVLNGVPDSLVAALTRADGGGR